MTDGEGKRRHHFGRELVFEPVVGVDLKLTEEEIEIGPVKPNKSLAQLHIKLLKVAKGKNELSSSKVTAEVAAGKTIETDVLPIIQKFYKSQTYQLYICYDVIFSVFILWSGCNDDDGSGDDYDSKRDHDNGNGSNKSDKENKNLSEKNVALKFGSRWSLRLAGVTNHHVVEAGNLGTKNRLRKLPTFNSAFDSINVLYSDVETLSRHTNSEIFG
ncbi:unnamed protein product [Dovyalis caffra]|uniref:Uncharacterized protein n=1 Tax=Dovyalis caffra TaxID=77055 RepID=A0AAV1SLE7_9ROSI|nr:unnamed protein product [Dovyalis caffra]